MEFYMLYSNMEILKENETDVTSMTLLKVMQLKYLKKIILTSLKPGLLQIHEKAMKIKNGSMSLKKYIYSK